MNSLKNNDTETVISVSQDATDLFTDENKSNFVQDLMEITRKELENWILKVVERVLEKFCTDIVLASGN